MELPELSWGAATHTGQRAENQDSYLAAPPIFAVADGMGGHAEGKKASEIAVARLAEIAQGPTVSVQAIKAALEQADKDIQALGQSIEAGSRPGTTVAGIALTEHEGEICWVTFNVGDSRIYRWSEADGLQQVSTDHSVVQALVDAGAITEERALTHPQRHMITKALGFGDRGGPDFQYVPVAPGQRLLVCTDGLTGELSDVQIADVTAAEQENPGLADALVARAVDVAAQDNVTIVVVCVSQ
ncbi:PP2C family protein-serine/threonine phosphatase [Geodermatophilus sp. SYSU D00815]